MTIPPAAAAGFNFTGAAGSRQKDSPQKIQDAASQFEALMIGQILKAAHGDSDDGGLGGDTDPASASAMDFANESFARAMAAKGGLGFSKMIAAGLEKQATPAAAPAPTAPEE